MNTTLRVGALVLCIAGALGSALPAAAARQGPGTFDRTPGFLKRAELALEEGRLDRAVGLILPRMGLLRRSTDKHLANSTLCSAQLRLENLQMAAEACAVAVQSEYATWSDLNNLGVYHYAMGDFDAALSWFEQAAAVDPKRKDVQTNIEAAMVAIQR
ncbi:MAG: tetratricopeptide repeat protein [Pseudomonadota bacterium]